MTTAVLSIGSNLGDRLGHLRLAAEAFAPWLLVASSVYETPPWGPVAQEPYLNAVLVVDDPQTGAWGWLERARECERRAGRVRDVRWGPRTLDVDIVDVGGVISEDAELTLPHPYAHERAFVLLPWREIDPAASLRGVPLDVWVEQIAPSERASVRACAALSLLGSEGATDA